MPLGLTCLHQGETAECSEGSQVVDIVAVHGLNEDSVDTWTDSCTGINWLRDLIPKRLNWAQILAYGYDASAARFLSKGASISIRETAKDLVNTLYSERESTNRLRRPIIFVCHGIGGIIVKESLIYSSTQDHLRDQFVSTYAILFFGTPHERTRKSTWLDLEKLSTGSWLGRVLSTDRLLRYKKEDVISFQSVTDEFGPLKEHFRMFCFWEELPTKIGGRYEYIVPNTSAVMKLEVVERAGIPTPHLRMTKFDSEFTSSYRTALEALLRYSQDAQRVVARRWDKAVATPSETHTDDRNEPSPLMHHVYSSDTLQENGVGTSQSAMSHSCPLEGSAPEFVVG
ncbi:hypothetical protein GGS20DRAFT_97593 [Poronia punctata]|nr:hypothetical protein GGS20DRAFT_97593 [Poronia punctata]